MVLSCLGADEPVTMVGVRFNMRRRRNQVELWFHAQSTREMSFSWNVTKQAGATLKTFAEARLWASAYAARYGQTVTEIKEERIRRAVGADRKMFKAGRCLEAWLSSDVPELAAEAMMRCKHAAGFCWQDGFCHRGTCDMDMIATDPPSAA